MNKKFYDFMGHLVAPLYNVLFPSKVTGLENIPDEGGFILCPNHLHARDPFFVALRVRSKRRITFLGKSELVKNPLLKLILGEKGFGMIPINRGESDLSAVRTCIKILTSGEALGVFPQGTRSRDNTPTPMLTGVSMIAVRAAVPIIPVYIDGPYRAFHRADVFIGQPVEYADLGRKVDSATLQEITHRIENAVWSMKPKH